MDDQLVIRPHQVPAQLEVSAICLAPWAQGSRCAYRPPGNSPTPTAELRSAASVLPTSAVSAAAQTYHFIVVFGVSRKYTDLGWPDYHVCAVCHEYSYKPATDAAIARPAQHGQGQEPQPQSPPSFVSFLLQHKVEKAQALAATADATGRAAVAAAQAARTRINAATSTTSAIEHMSALFSLS